MVGLLQILGGLALFIYGIRMLSAGMEKLTGEQIQRWLEKVTSGSFRSALFGTVATARSKGLLRGAPATCLHSEALRARERGNLRRLVHFALKTMRDRAKLATMVWLQRKLL